MAPSHRYLERDLFDLGATAQYLLERAHDFWVWADPEDRDREVPAVLRGLVEDLTAGLRHLAWDVRLECVSQLMHGAEESLSGAWEAYQRHWMGDEHRQQCFGAADWECMPSVEDLERLSPLATVEWCHCRTLLDAVLTGLPQDLSVWPKLGSLMVQVLGLNADTRKQACVLGDVFPIPKLQDLLRTVRDAHSVLSDLDVELSDREVNALGYKNVEEVQSKVKVLRQAIVDRLVTASVAFSQPADEIARPAAGTADPVLSTVAIEPEYASAQVKLYGPGKNPVVTGKSKPILTPAQYNIVQALIEAGDDGVTKDEFDRKSGHTDSRKIMKTLANSDPDWQSVLLLAGATGRGYRIR